MKTLAEHLAAEPFELCVVVFGLPIAGVVARAGRSWPYAHPARRFIGRCARRWTVGAGLPATVLRDTCLDLPDRRFGCRSAVGPVAYLRRGKGHRTATGNWADCRRIELSRTLRGQASTTSCAVYCRKAVETLTTVRFRWLAAFCAIDTLQTEVLDEGDRRWPSARRAVFLVHVSAGQNWRSSIRRRHCRSA